MNLGMASMAFRWLNAEQIIDFASDFNMNVIEWSACHIPVGELIKAENVFYLCKEAGLVISAYNSDYCVPLETTHVQPFDEILHTAQSLGTDCVRIKAGNISSEKADDVMLYNFMEETLKLAKAAEEKGITISFPFCANTLFDNYNSAMALLERIDAKNIYIDWRPNQTTSMIYNIYELKMMIRYIKNVHVFYQNTLGENLPLVEGRDGWQQYLKILRFKPDRALLLESVPNDSPEEMARYFALLKELAQG